MQQLDSQILYVFPSLEHREWVLRALYQRLSQPVFSPYAPSLLQHGTPPMGDSLSLVSPIWSLQKAVVLPKWLQFFLSFTDCSGMGHLWTQFLPDNLLQHWLPSSFLSWTLFSRGSPRGHIFKDTSRKPPSATPWSAGGSLLPCGFAWAAGAQVPHDLHHWLQENLGSSTWSSSSFFTDLVSAVVALTYSHSSVPVAAVQQFPPFLKTSSKRYYEWV